MSVPTQKRVLQILHKETKSNQDRQQLIIALRRGCYDMPDASYENAYELLKSKKNNSDQKFINIEQIILNAMKLKIPAATIKKYLQSFAKQIGQTRHIQKLAAFINYVCNPEPFKDELVQFVKEDMTDLDSRKRVLTVYKRQNKMDEYVKKLNFFLEENPSDTQAWVQMSQLYTERGQYLRALFCLEQIIVIHPQNNHYMVKLAQLYYTLGGKDNLNHAIKYFSHVVSRYPHNMRALWGLYRSLHAQGDKIDANNVELLQLCQDSIHKQYSKKNPNLKLHLAF